MIGDLPWSAVRVDGKLRSARARQDPRKRLSRPLTKGPEATIFRRAKRLGSSMAEQLTLNQFVVGSSPARGTSFPGVLQRCRTPFSCRQAIPWPNHHRPSASEARGLHAADERCDRAWRRDSMSRYDARINAARAGASTGCAGRSLTWRMSFPVPWSNPFGSGS